MIYNQIHNISEDYQFVLSPKELFYDKNNIPESLYSYDVSQEEWVEISTNSNTFDTTYNNIKNFIKEKQFTCFRGVISKNDTFNQFLPNEENGDSPITWNEQTHEYSYVTDDLYIGAVTDNTNLNGFPSYSVPAAGEPLQYFMLIMSKQYGILFVPIKTFVFYSNTIIGDENDFSIENNQYLSAKRTIETVNDLISKIEILKVITNAHPVKINDNQNDLDNHYNIPEITNPETNCIYLVYQTIENNASNANIDDGLNFHFVLFAYNKTKQYFEKLDTLTFDITEYALASHKHGNITSDGKVGSATNKPLITTTGGKVTTGSFASDNRDANSGKNVFVSDADYRLRDSRDPTSHTYTNPTLKDYGTATTSVYGHVKLSDSVTVNDNNPITSDAVYHAFTDAGDNQINNQHTHTKSQITDFAHADTDGDYGKASTTKYGHVKLISNIADSANNETNPATTQAIKNYVANELSGKQNSFVSGQDIKTINNSSILGSGNIDLQVPLVSGSNIRTINNKSLFPTISDSSTNISVQEVLTSGSNIKTINSSSILGSGNINLQTPLTAGTDYYTPNQFITNISSSSTSTIPPTTKAVKDYIDNVQSSISSGISNVSNDSLSIPQEIPNNSNLSNYTTAGLYYSKNNNHNITGAPNSHAFFLFVETSGSTIVKQTFTIFDQNNPKMWVRTYEPNGGWGNWKLVAYDVTPENTSSNIKANGSVSVGSLTTYARGDHIHPTDTSRAPVSHTSSDNTYGVASASVYGHAKASSSTPNMDGTASAGTDNGLFARGDHTHPTDTSRAQKSHASSSTEYGVAAQGTYGHVKPTTTTPIVNGTAAVGSEVTQFARGDHVHPSDSTKVDKVSGKGLSTNDYTTAEKNKLAGMIDDANKLTITPTLSNGNNTTKIATITNKTASGTQNLDLYAETDTDTTYTAGTGLTLTNENIFNHNNNVNAEQTTAVFKKITYDRQGHITGVSDVQASDIPAHASSSDTFGAGSTTNYGHVKVDNALSNSSTNTIQNKIIYEALAGKVDKMVELTGDVNLNNIIDIGYYYHKGEGTTTPLPSNTFLVDNDYYGGDTLYWLHVESGVLHIKQTISMYIGLPGSEYGRTAIRYGIYNSENEIIWTTWEHIMTGKDVQSAHWEKLIDTEKLVFYVNKLLRMAEFRYYSDSENLSSSDIGNVKTYNTSEANKTILHTYSNSSKIIPCYNPQMNMIWVRDTTPADSALRLWHNVSGSYAVNARVIWRY